MSESTSTTRLARPVAGASAAGAARVSSPRQLALLVGLLAVLAVLIVYLVLPAVSGGGSTPAQSSERGASAPAAARAGRAPQQPVVDVRLERLTDGAADPLEDGRNPFRMGPAAPPPGQAASRPAGPPTPAQPAAPTGPPPPPAVPTIPLKFIGIVTATGRAGKMAVLSDGRNVFSGREGEIVDGRYRIVRIGEESIQIEHQDGRGRQTIRLSGQ